MHYAVRDFRPEEASAVDAVALAAFGEFAPAYADRAAFSRSVGNVAALATSGELIVAAAAGKIVGTVAYIGPGKPKAPFFEPQWPIIRLLAVAPTHRGLGIGRALTAECLRRARRDGSTVIALHTTPIMQVALSMYRRMGFEFHRDAPPILGVAYGIYLKHLSGSPCVPRG